MDIHKTTILFAPLVFCVPVLSWVEEDLRESKPMFHAEVDMVSISVVVTDRHRKPVTDLQASDFRIFEDGVEQTVAAFSSTEEPVSVVLALDTSGSVAVRMSRIQIEAVRFIRSLHSEDRVAILSFGGGVNLLDDFTCSRAVNANAIERTRAGGLTELYDAVWFALNDVLRPVKGRKAIVLFSDGVDSQSQKSSETQTEDLASKTFSPIYCIYFNTERDWPAAGRDPKYLGPIPPSPPSRREEYLRGRSYLACLSQSTGGLLLDALRTDDLGRVFQEIAKEISSQYSIGYYPVNQKRDGRFRSVLVMLKQPGLVVRTRPGYVF
jgi:Ca-activated chloride channel family protein